MRRTSALGVGLLAAAGIAHFSGLYPLQWWGWVTVGTASAIAITADATTAIYRRRTLRTSHG